MPLNPSVCGILLLIGLPVGGCSVYSDYGYGRIARSKLDWSE